MQTLQHPISNVYTPTARNKSLAAKFMDWCRNQEPNRYGWLAVILFVHGCILAPIAMMAIFLNGVNIVLIAAVIVAMTAALISNLAAMPTRITLPIFFFGVLIDLVVIIISIVQYFMA
jgi:hypothetical protein